jgi:signal transduction histidine kinase
MEIATHPERMPRSMETALFRVLQESLTNVHRHSKAAHVTVCFRHQFEKVILEIRDDGCGIEGERLVRLRETSAETGVGLAGMRERMHELNGTLEMESEGRGTTIRAVVPLRAGTPSLSQVAEDSRKRAPQSSEYQISPLRSGDAGIAAD